MDVEVDVGGIRCGERTSKARGFESRSPKDTLKRGEAEIFKRVRGSRSDVHVHYKWNSRSPSVNARKIDADVWARTQGSYFLWVLIA